MRKLVFVSHLSIETGTLKHFTIFFPAIFFLASVSCKETDRSESKKAIIPGQTMNDTNGKLTDLKKIYDEYTLEGTFILYDPSTKTTSFYNKSLAEQDETPASTFNIVTSLIALEEGICKDENTVIPWSGTASVGREANKDLTLQYGFQNNIDWLFFDLRKKIGAIKIKAWLEKLQYGNCKVPDFIDSSKTNGTLKDMFWVVSSETRISPAQQLEFIKKLYSHQLPFSATSIATVKKMLYEKDINGFRVYGKRGSYLLTVENKYIGWFAGFAEKEGKAYIFVNFVQTPDLTNTKIIKGQREIALKVLERIIL